MEGFVFHTGRFTAQRALLLSWSVWFFLLLAMPVSPVFLGNLDSVLLLVCANVALWLGLSASTLWRGRSEGNAVTRRAHASGDIDALLILLIIAGCVTLIIRPIDFFVVRGVDFSLQFEHVRAQLTAAGPNLLSAAYGALFPAAVAGGILAVPLLQTRKRRALPALAIASCLAAPAFSVLVGGRSVLFMIAGLLLITWIISVPRISGRLVLGTAFGFLGVFLATALVLFLRVADRGVEFDWLAQFSAFTQLVPLHDSVLIALRDLPQLPGILLLNIVSTGQYFLHGVFEFFALVRLKSPDDPLLLGRYEFLIFDQIQRIFQPGTELPDLETFNPTSGLFTTFWGPAYIDFGYYMVLFAFAFGLVVDWARRLVDAGDLFAVPMHVLFVLQIAMVPIANGLLMAAAITLNLAFFGLWALSRLLGPFLTGWHGAVTVGQERAAT